MAVLGARLGWMISEAFSTPDDPKPNALCYSPDGSNSDTFRSVFIARGRGRREVCCG